jgi:transposase
VYKNYIGIDVSKRTLDFAVIDAKQRGIVFQSRRSNSKDDLKQLKKELRKHRINLDKHSLVVLEHSGIYIRTVVSFLIKCKCSICVDSALRIKRSFGIQRGKSDAIDACRIAEYGFRNYDKLRLWKNPRESIFRLRDLLGLRERIMRVKNSIKAPLKEMQQFYSKAAQKRMTDLCSDAITGTSKSLKSVEYELKMLIRSDYNISNQLTLLTSIPGVGRITSLYLICYTHEFTVTTSARHLASYAGIAPFEFESGTSIQGKAHVHPIANKHLKRLLHTAALQTIKLTGEHRKYFEKKTGEGKHAFSVINAVRNKVVKRIAAVITRGTPYLPKKKYDRMMRKVRAQAQAKTSILNET